MNGAVATSARNLGLHSNGLILSGGGARAAYQVGVLAAIAGQLPEAARNPFPVISGTSAGSINALLLATQARDFPAAVGQLQSLWSNLAVDDVYRTDGRTLLKTLLRWLGWLTFLRHPRHAPRALLDNAPLRRMLERHCPLSGLREAIADGDLRALAVSAASYTRGRSVSFFQGGPGTAPWSRTRRDGVATEIDVEHVMASVALPMIFPAVRLGDEYFGDGSMRQAAPLSAPIHLGASRLLVIGMRSQGGYEQAPPVAPEYPGFGEIGGYVLDSLFMDSLHADIERLRRINELVRQLGGTAAESLREVDVTVILPSQDPGLIAQRHLRRLPRTMKTLLRVLGGARGGSAQLASYLLFDGAYCRELIELGYQDGMHQRDALASFTRDMIIQSR